MLHSLIIPQILSEILFSCHAYETNAQPNFL